MRRFLNGSNACYGKLERQARSAAYLNFRGAELPPGCVPSRSRIGLALDPRSGVTTVFVERGIRYYGASQSILRWMQDGGVSFPSFAEFRQWIDSVIKPEFEKNNASQTSAEHTQEASGNASRSSHSGPETANETARPNTAPTAMKPLLEFLVKQTAKRYEVEVCSVETSVLAELQDKLSLAKGETSCDLVADDLFGGPFALASVEGHRLVNVHAGPPITCKPTTSKS